MRHVLRVPSDPIRPFHDERPLRPVRVFERKDAQHGFDRRGAFRDRPFASGDVFGVFFAHEFGELVVALSALGAALQVFVVLQRFHVRGGLCCLTLGDYAKDSRFEHRFENVRFERIAFGVFHDSQRREFFDSLRLNRFSLGFRHCPVRFEKH